MPQPDGPDHDPRLKVLSKEFFEAFLSCFFPVWAERFDTPRRRAAGDGWREADCPDQRPTVMPKALITHTLAGHARIR